MDTKELQILLSPPDLSPVSDCLQSAPLALISEALSSNWIAPCGPFVDRFEQDFAACLDIPYSVAVSSGTAAIHLALQALGVSSQDTVFCSDLTFIAAAAPIIYCQARPVFIDSAPGSWNMDPELLRQALAQSARKGKLPKAVVVVHLYGHPAELEPICEVCEKYEIPLIEDAAESLGAKYCKRPVGTFGEIGIFSFNGNKIITTSGGGMLVCRSEKHAVRARYLATQARELVDYYEHQRIGFNYRLSNLLAALGVSQLQVLEQRIQARRENFFFYQEQLQECPGVSFLCDPSQGFSTHWLSCLLIDERVYGESAEQLRQRLLSCGVESRRVWKPMHLQPVFQGCEVFGGKVSEKLFQSGLCLPSGSNLTECERELVVAVIERKSR